MILAAQRLGLKLTAPPADVRAQQGEVLVSQTEPLKLELLGQTLADARLNVMEHPRYMPMDIDGLIGWRNIRQNLWLFRGSERRLNLLKEIPPETTGWLAVREDLQRTKLTWELPPDKSGAVVRLGVDTGADSGVRLSPAAWTEWRKAHPRAPITIEAYSMPGMGLPLIIAEQSWADEITLGGLVLHGVSVISMNPLEMQSQAPETLAVLGLGAIARMDAVIDGKNDRAYLNPLKDKPSVPVHNRLGAVFAPNDPRTDNDLVAHVTTNSPAAKAGVQTGDLLLKIDELDVTLWRTRPGILPLRRFFVQPAGTRMQLTLRRGNQTIVRHAILRDVLGPSGR
jgi:hypothetical protein